MIFIALVVAAAIVFAVQAAVYSRNSLKGLTYRSGVDRTEVTEGEELAFWEELSNAKTLPMPQVRADTELPQGLLFRVYENEGGKPVQRGERSVRSVFSLRGEEAVRRSWTIQAQKRGTYLIDNTMVIAGDMLGGNRSSRRVATEGRPAAVTVLPRPMPLENFVRADLSDGEIPVALSFVCDPMLRVGEESGTVGDMLAKIAGNLENDTRLKIKRLLSLFEPAVIVFLAVVVLVVVVSIFVAMMEINSISQGGPSI